jgi:hypothetical protein
MSPELVTIIVLLAFVAGVLIGTALEHHAARDPDHYNR